MCYPVCGVVHKKTPCCQSESVADVVAVADFLSRYINCTFTICLTPYNVLSASLSKTFPSFHTVSYTRGATSVGRELVSDDG